MSVAFSSIAWNTGSSSPGELLMTCSTSEVAVCCSSASLVSLNNGHSGVAALAAGDQIKNRRGKNGARYLRYNVGCYLVRREAPPSREADCHRRVEMTPRDMADCVGHREHSEPKGGRNAEQADADLGKGG